MGKKKYDLNSAKEIIKEYGGTLLSDEYISTKKKLKIKCNSCGKNFEKTLEKVMVSKNAVCRNCGSRKGASNRLLSIEEIKSLVEGLGGILISTEYINAKTPLKLKCPKCNNIFSRETQIIKKTKSIICKNCSSRLSNEVNRLHIDEVKKTIEELGSTLLTKEYNNNQENLEIKCSCGRKIKRSYNNILRRKNVRCEICSEKISNGEKEILRQLEIYKVEYKYQQTFEKCKYKGLLKFDFYIPSKNIAIEYDGELHYKPSELFGGVEKMKLQQKRDRVKDQFCIENNIKLLRIPYWEFKNIENILRENKIIPSQA